MKPDDELLLLSIVGMVSPSVVVEIGFGNAGLGRRILQALPKGGHTYTFAEDFEPGALESSRVGLAFLNCLDSGRTQQSFSRLQAFLTSGALVVVCNVAPTANDVVGESFLNWIIANFPDWKLLRLNSSEVNPDSSGVALLQR